MSGALHFDPDAKDQSWTQQAFPRLAGIADADSFPKMDEFHRLARTNRLPDFSFIEPAWTLEGRKLKGFSTRNLHGIQGNEMHPPGDVRPGEDFVAAIYTSLIANPDTWNSTLFIITFDEHGGLYDHVAPTKATPPDGHNQDGFNFDRFGVRVPTLMVSPHIQPRTVFRSPSDVPFDHTSIAATLLKWRGLDPGLLGQRTAHAPTFDEVLNSETPPQPQAPTQNAILCNHPHPHPHDSGDAVTFGDTFHLTYTAGSWSGYQLAAVHDLSVYPSAGRSGAVPLRFTLGQNKQGDFVAPSTQAVTHGSCVHLRTLEEAVRLGEHNRDLCVDNHYIEAGNRSACYYGDDNVSDSAATWRSWIVKIVRDGAGRRGCVGQPVREGDTITLELRNPTNIDSWLPGKLVPYESVAPPGRYLKLSDDADYATAGVGEWKITRVR